MPNEKTIDLRNWFGFRKLPFAVNVSTKDIFLTKSIEQMSSKVRFAMQKALENQQTSVCADVIREVTRNWWEK